MTTALHRWRWRSPDPEPLTHLFGPPSVPWSACRQVRNLPERFDRRMPGRCPACESREEELQDRRK